MASVCELGSILLSPTNPDLWVSAIRVCPRLFVDSGARAFAELLAEGGVGAVKIVFHVFVPVYRHQLDP